ncbi:MAG: AbrB/MazE/SpoVT family DNA-binding domain-containing protein [Pseudomonadota bacterium]
MSTEKPIKLDREGRVLIPAKLRKALALQPGDELIVNLVDGERLELVAKAAKPRIAKRRLKEALARG